jgi:putative ABC transport system permease protein
VGVAVALATGIATGVVPALQSTRTDTLPALREESAGAGTRRTRLREALTVLQVAVAVVLLAASGLVVRSFLNVHRGAEFDADRLIVPRLRPSLVGYSAERSWAFQREVIRRLEETPGVVAASPASIPPLPRWGMSSAELRLVGSAAEPFQIATTPVGPRYFKTLGVPLLEGREFDDSDNPNGPTLAVVNETLARHFWPQGGAVGNVVRIGETLVEIIGVVKNYHHVSVFAQPRPVAYFDYWRQDTAANWSHDSRTHVRVAGNAAAMLPTILNVIAAVDPDVPISGARPLVEQIDEEFSELRTARAMFLTFGGLTLALSAIGLYAALAFAVGQRRREIAIRMALGADRITVGALVLRRGGFVVALGLVAGLAVSLGTGPIIAHMLYGVSPRDPLTLLAGPSVLVAIALVAMWLPARRAMGTDPIAALRAE